MVIAVELEAPKFLSRKDSIINSLIFKSFIGESKQVIDSFLHSETEENAHFLIDENGNIFSFIKEESAAITSSSSYWRGIEDINLSSLTVAIVCEKEGTFTQNQINTLIDIAKEKVLAHNIPPQNIVSMCDVSFVIHTVTDFPWKEMAQNGVGLWIDEDIDETEEGDLLDTLNEIGYRVTVQNYKMAITAFQRRFFPNHISGENDIETLKRANSIKRLFNSTQ